MGELAHGSWSVNGGDYCGVRIDGPDGRSVVHVIQRDPHPTIGQGITQAEAQATAARIVALWNAAGLVESEKKGAQP